MGNWFQKVGMCMRLGAGYMRVMPQLVYGAWHVAGLPQPIVSIFGGSRFQQQSFYFDLAYTAGHELVAHNISVITGGGPGIMEAANCGAAETGPSHKRTLGITVTELGEEKPNTCAPTYIETDYFAIRKHLLINYSLGFIVFPGGFGTMDELAQLLTLMQTGKLPQAPVILIGAEYWSSFFDWINVAEGMGLVLPEHVSFLTITDDIDYACSRLIKHCQACEV